MVKFYTIEKKIGDTTYTAQFNGLSAALEAADNSYIDGTQNTSSVKITKYLLEHVIVEPKGLTIDDFEDISELNEVITFARQVMQGEFRDKKDAETANPKSGK